MGDNGKKPESSNTKVTSLHPAYTVTNIQNKIRTLDGSKVSYSSWIKLFRLQAKAYKVTDHLDADPPEKNSDDYDQWAEIDALVLQWIYNTVSDEILARIIENDKPARVIWKKIQDIFLSNKGSRAAALEHEFTNLQLTACSSMDEYCQKLKDLADQLNDVDNPVSEARLVLQLVRGLPMEYDVVGTFINQSSPTWDVARSMLQLEIHRQKARQNPTNVAMVSPQALPTSQPLSNHGQSLQQNYNNRPYDNNRNRGRGRNNWRGGGRYSNRGGRGRSNGNNAWNQHGFGQQQHNWWGPPPCPYPSQPTWQNNNQMQAMHPSQQQPSNVNYGPQQQQYGRPQPALNALSPTDLVNAFQNMQINFQDSNWYMDTGASSHVTADPGSNEWQNPLPPQ